MLTHLTEMRFEFLLFSPQLSKSLADLHQNIEIMVTTHYFSGNLSSRVQQFCSMVTVIMMGNDTKCHDLDASLSYFWLLFKVRY